MQSGTRDSAWKNQEHRPFRPTFAIPSRRLRTRAYRPLPTSDLGTSRGEGSVYKRAASTAAAPTPIGLRKSNRLLLLRGRRRPVWRWFRNRFPPRRCVAIWKRNARFRDRPWQHQRNPRNHSLGLSWEVLLSASSTGWKQASSGALVGQEGAVVAILPNWNRSGRAERGPRVGHSTNGFLFWTRQYNTYFTKLFPEATSQH